MTIVTGREVLIGCIVRKDGTMRTLVGYIRKIACQEGLEDRDWIRTLASIIFTYPSFTLLAGFPFTLNGRCTRDTEFKFVHHLNQFHWPKFACGDVHNVSKML